MAKGYEIDLREDGQSECEYLFQRFLSANERWRATKDDHDELYHLCKEHGDEEACEELKGENFENFREAGEDLTEKKNEFKNKCIAKM
jgi:hypothetical protein